MRMGGNILPNNISIFCFSASALYFIFCFTQLKKISVVSISPCFTTDRAFHYSFSILFIPHLSPWIAFGIFSCHSNFSFVCSSTQTQAPAHTPTSSHKLSPLLPSLSAPSLRTRIPLPAASWLHKWFPQSLGVSLTLLFSILSHLTVIMALEKFWFFFCFIKTKMIILGGFLPRFSPWLSVCYFIELLRMWDFLMCHWRR